MKDLVYMKRMKIGDRELCVQGDREFVEGEFDSLLVRVFGESDLSSYVEPLRKSPEVETESPRTLREFFDEKKPRTKLDSMLMIGYYIENVRGEEVFTRAELESYARKNKIVLGSNPTRDLNRLIAEKGLLERYGEKTGQEAFRMTMSGEKRVESELGE